MKAGIILSIIALALTLFIASLILEIRDRDRLQQSIINGLRDRNIKERDSLELILKLKSDSLNIAFETIKQATAEREERHRITQRTIENLKRIVYIQHNDSSRIAEIKTLYPSWNELKNQ